jgi:hypothetical protein
MTHLSGASIYEVQSVHCYASGGSFRLRFYGELTSSILSTANAAVVKSALEALSTVNDVNVTFQSAITSACGSAEVGNGFVFGDVRHVHTQWNK